MSNRKARPCKREEFLALHRAAIAAAPPRWRYQAGDYIWARVPAVMLRYKAHNRSVTPPRDMPLPAAKYWPAGLPNGLEDIWES